MSAVPDVTPADALQDAYDALRAAQIADPYPSYRTRRAWLKALLNEVISSQEEFARAVSADFGHRSWHESGLGETWITAECLRQTLKHLKAWMKPGRLSIPWYFQPGAARSRPQPKGVVGVMGPFNYPMLNTLAPVIDALGAGNRVLIKPSEATPRVSAYLEDLVRASVPADVARVVHGNASVGSRFAELPLDHILFTGSPRVGKLVMAAAAKRLTPVTLELGGKSPAIVTPGFDLARAADRITMGRLFNAGQTCVGVDTVWVHERDHDALVRQLEQTIPTFYPTLRDNPDYTSLHSDAAKARVAGLVEDAERRGATVIRVNPAGEDMSASRKHEPTLVLDCPEDAVICDEEVFGPVLLIRRYARMEDLLLRLREGPRPLVLYLFDDDPERTAHILDHTHAGSAVVNDVFATGCTASIPFGGIGNSGMGAYHGKAGFDTFSHHKSVYYASRLDSGRLFNPPYGWVVNKMLPFLIGSD